MSVFVEVTPLSSSSTSPRWQGGAQDLSFAKSPSGRTSD